MKYTKVNTVDSYQGQEKDVIIFSCVRTEGVGFLNDRLRVNVALTRARKCLIVVANFSSLQTDKTWKSLWLNAKQRGLIRDIPKSCTNLVDLLKPQAKKNK
uniref:AAA_12 domain-containing protein n=3 Tax=Rhodnius prolixus TaxID=13249 RepID=T1HP33_RHOPR